MENAKQAYDAFNRLWGKVPRTCRVDRENHQLMLEVRAYFDVIIETAKRASIVDSALAAANATPNTESGPDADDDEPADPVRQALRLLRTLSGLEWQMVRAIVDLHKFANEDFVDIVNVIRDTHCKRCGEWLDDDDEHEDCPVPDEDETEEAEPVATEAEAEPAAPKTADMYRPTGAERVAAAVTTPQTVMRAPAVHPALVPTPTTLPHAAESEPKITPRE